MLELLKKRNQSSYVRYRDGKYNAFDGESYGVLTKEQQDEIYSLRTPHRLIPRDEKDRKRS